MTNLTDTHWRNPRLIGACILGLVLLTFAVSQWKSSSAENNDDTVADNTIPVSAVTHVTNSAEPEPPQVTVEPTAGGRTIMVLGDSISAAYGLDESIGWVQLLQTALATSHPGTQVINASISGETTTGGLQRLPDALKRFSPDLVIIELGGNDGLRGQSLSLMRDNLNTMVELSLDAGAQPILVGMRIPPNYGKVYADGFHQTYLDIAAEKNIQLVPFLFETIAQDRQYFQPDGIHPTAEAQPLLLEQVFPIVEQLMDSFE